MVRFLICVVALTILLPLAASIGRDKGVIPTLPSFLIETTVIVAILTAIIVVYLLLRSTADTFVQFYLVTVVVKLIGFLAYNVWMIMEDRTGAKANVVYFLVTYLVFSALETSFLYRKIRSRSAR